MGRTTLVGTGAGAGTDAGGRRRARDRSLVRNGLVAVLVAASLWAAWAVREVPDPARPPAVELTTRMDQLYRQVRSGEVALGTDATEVDPGVIGARFPRTTASDRWVLAGQLGDTCYVLWWDEEGVRRTRTLRQGDPCEPSVDAMSPRPGTYDRIGRTVVADPDAPSAWEGVVPDPVRLRLWYLPWMIVGGGVMLSALVRMSIALITGAPPSTLRR